MKKFLVFLISTFIVVGLLSGCGSSDANNTDDLSGKTIVVGRWGGNDAETAAFNKMVAEFTKKTGIKVEQRIYSDYNMELQVELIGGTAPDVFYVDAYMAPFFIEQGVLLELDYDEFELDKFYQPLTNAFIKDGKVYAVSKDYSTLALYYNKKYVNAEEIPDTLEELWTSDFLTNLKAKLPSGMAAMTYNQDLARKMFIAQGGGVSIVRDEIYSNLSDPKIVENLTPLFEAAKEGKLVTPQDLGVGWNGDAFGNEKTAMMIEGNWVLGFLEQNFPEVEFGVIEVPTFRGEKGTMVFTVGYGIYSKSKEVEAAKEFIKFATGTEGMAIWTKGAGVLPSRADVAEAIGVMDDQRKVPHILGAEYATPWQKGTTLDTINNEFRNYIPSVVKGERTLAEALKIAEEEANKIIRQN
ncbi:ABC transporter substrate-binding protein [Anaerobranca gottschalkii]|uniref:Multiple sugar transport system substrate-binding protein n=1 Tax=Anaerobranca gottschalkii DSM 13577 TaxID=1120990 RepID=A0A1H9YNT3_9FIRM|nr:extracellular solute-binding protein [Anaerobranca gottschalkii]SES70786.1 multiple sugar transport system substrate-binding protein [Anaerobranca gottschalkii DSM 13577]